MTILSMHRGFPLMRFTHEISTRGIHLSGVVHHATAR